MRTKGEIDVGPLEVVALRHRQLFHLALCPFRVSHQNGEAGGERIGLQETLVKQIGQDHAQSKIQEALEEVDGVEVDEMGAPAHTVVDASIPDAELHHPTEYTGTDDGDDVRAGGIDVDQEYTDEDGTDAGDQHARDANAPQPAASVVHQKRADDHGCHGNVEQIHRPLEARLRPTRGRAAQRYQGDQQWRVGAIAVTARQFRRRPPPFSNPLPGYHHWPRNRAGCRAGTQQ